MENGEQSFLKKPEKIYASHPELVEEQLEFYKERYKTLIEHSGKEVAHYELDYIVKDLAARGKGTYYDELEKFSQEDIKNLGVKLIDFAKQEDINLENYRTDFENIDINSLVEEPESELE